MEEHYGRVLCESCKGKPRPDDPRFRMLPDHTRCEGVPWCECWTEVLIEAEDMTDGD